MYSRGFTKEEETSTTIFPAHTNNCPEVPGQTPHGTSWSWLSPGTGQGSCLVIHKSLQASDDLTSAPYPIGAVRKAISQLPKLQNKIHALSPPELLSRARTRLLALTPRSHLNCVLQRKDRRKVAYAETRQTELWYSQYSHCYELPAHTHRNCSAVSQTGISACI